MGILNWVFQKFGGPSALAGLADRVMAVADEKINIVDFSTGSLKSGGEVLVKGAVSTLGDILRGEIVPAVVGIFGNGRSPDKTYLGLSFAIKLKENLVGKEGKSGVRRALEGIPDVGAIGEYKRDSIELIDAIKTLLDSYIEEFNIFKGTKILKIFNKKVKFTDVRSARKEMKECLNRILKLLSEYDSEKYTQASLNRAKAKLMSETSTTKEYKELVETVAYGLFENSYNFLLDNKDLKVTIDGSTKSILDVDLKKEADKFLGAIFTESKHKSRIIMSLWYTDGMHQDIKNGTALNKQAAQLSQYAGWKVCITTAEDIVKSLLGSSEIDIPIAGKTVGDYAMDLEKCFKYTEGEINTVINLGAKNEDLNPKKDDGKVVVESSDSTKGPIGIDLVKLLGEDYYKANESKWKTRKKTLDDSISKNLLKNMTKACASADKEYEKIKKLQKKYFPKEEDRKDNLSKLIVKLPSRSDEKGEKEYNISKRYETEIKKLEKDALESVSKEETKTEKDDRVSLAYRKADKFLEACKQWNSDFQDYKKKSKKEAEDIFLLVKRHLKKASSVYKELLKTDEITREQKDTIKKAYKALPMFPYTYLRKFKDNRKKMEDFLGLHFEKGSLLDKDNKKIC